MEYQTTRGRGRSTRVYSMRNNFWGFVRGLTAYDAEKHVIGNFNSHEEAIAATVKWGQEHIR